MSHSVHRHLHVEAAAYDAAIRRFIPGYEAMVDRLVDEVVRARPLRVLDLGAGTGALSAALLERARDARVELWDVDPEMLAVARERLAGFGERALFVERSFDEAFPPCDAIMASLSLHHIPRLEGKAALFQRAHAAIRPGGVFVNADVTMPRGGPERDELYRAWADHQVAEGIVEPQAWQNFDEWAKEDTYFPLDDELQALESAGFVARCVWRQGPSTVWVGEV